jgi:hypothetical protein
MSSEGSGGQGEGSIGRERDVPEHGVCCVVGGGGEAEGKGGCGAGGMGGVAQKGPSARGEVRPMRL